MAKESLKLEKAHEEMLLTLLKNLDDALARRDTPFVISSLSEAYKNVRGY